MLEKICTRCKISKDLESFYSHTQGVLGRNSWCKTCVKEDWRSKHPAPSKDWRKKVRKCSGCGQDYKWRFHGAKYCSKECSSKNRKPHIRKGSRFTALQLYLKGMILRVKRYQKFSSLTFSDLEEIYERQEGLCSYSGTLLSWKGCGWENQFGHMSLDRISPGGPYEKDNVTLCCYLANVGKLDYEKETWLSLCAAVTKFQRLVV